MDAIFGKYRLRMEETSLILTYPTGMSFDLTLEETVGLMEFVKSYRAAIAAAQRDTEPRFEGLLRIRNPVAIQVRANFYETGSCCLPVTLVYLAITGRPSVP